MQEQGVPLPVEEVAEPLTWQDFYRRFVRANRPVVLRGHATGQRAFGLWTDDYLAKHWGSRRINVELNKTEERGAPGLSMTLREFLGEMYREERSGELYAIVDFDGDDKAKADFHLPEPLRCKEVAPQALTIWMSSGGTKSVLHEDDAENVLLLLAGRKTVMLLHQDEAPRLYANAAATPGTSPVHQESVDLVAFPRFANATWRYGELGPGDSLYIPHSYWHQVNSVGRNLAVNLWWGHNEEWRWWDPENRNEYDVRRFGAKGSPPFDELKGRGPESLPCTPLPQGESLTGKKFWDEERWKRRLVKRRRKALARGEL